jgi:predicted NodU family carbamoyl transferase
MAGQRPLMIAPLTCEVIHGLLIEAFRELMGVPMVLNTSFNENEPIV